MTKKGHQHFFYSFVKTKKVIKISKKAHQNNLCVKI